MCEGGRPWAQPKKPRRWPFVVAAVAVILLLALVLVLVLTDVEIVLPKG